MSDEQGDGFHQDIKTMGQMNNGWQLLEYHRYLNNIEHDNQEKNHGKNFLYVQKSFISVSLLKDLMKILIGLDIYKHVNDLGSDLWQK